MALVNGRSKLAKILAEKGRWRRSPVTSHQDSLAETGKLRTLRECTESIVFVQYGALRPRDLSSDLRSKKLDVETFLCQSRKKISFSKINLLNLRKNLLGPWGSTQLGERSPKPVSHLKLETRKVSHLTSPQNRPTCTCSTLPRASARTSPMLICRRPGESNSSI